MKKQQINWDEKTNKCFLETLNEDGSITSEEITIKKAAEWKAENDF